jgi:hypothetical protein
VYVTIAQLQCLRVEEAVVAHEEKPHDPWPVEHFAQSPRSSLSVRRREPPSRPSGSLVAFKLPLSSL